MRFPIIFAVVLSIAAVGGTQLEGAVAPPGQQCAPGVVSGQAVCGVRDSEERFNVARGNECPAASDSYCSDEFPVCCWSESKGYYCASSLSNC